MSKSFLAGCAFAAMAAILAQAPAQAQSPASGAAVTYTQAQAERGKALFRRHCLFCHSTNQSNIKSPDEPRRGFDVGGAQRMVIPLGGRYIMKYPSVYHLWVRIRDAMPAWDIQSMTPAQKLDVVAYLLQESGFAPMGGELTMDAKALREMRLSPERKPAAEEGFTPIFNGRDFSGMKFLFGFNCTPQPDGCGKTEPLSFRIEPGGVLVAEGREHGYWYTAQRYLDFDLRFDFRWMPPADHQIGDEFFSTGSSGYLLFANEERVWPRALELEGDNMGLMRMHGMAATVTASTDEALVGRVNKGPGHWNEIRILSHAGTVEAYLNGTLTSRVTAHPFKEPGFIIFQYQGGRLMWRNIRIRRLDDGQ